MENGTEVLICNNSSVLGSLLADRLVRYDVCAHSIRCERKLIMEKLAKGKTAVVVLCVSSERREEAEMIRTIRQQHENIRIIALSYASSREAGITMLEAGADLYMLMPVSVKELTEAVLMMINPDAKSSCESQIAAFLSENSADSNLSGFSYLCMAVRICLENPESIDNISELVYRPIAESFNTTIQIIERSLRFFSSAICSSAEKCTFIEDYYSGHEPLTNRELISIAADAFARANCIFESEPKNDAEILKNL